MFLADVVANYVESLNERELDAPLVALLHHLGFEHVHLIHGQYEFGKDFIAQRTIDGVKHQYCFQSKAGNLNIGDWRNVRLQIDAMRSGTVAHPNFDASLERRLVLVANGRLRGGASIEFQEYNTYSVSRGEAPVEFWGIEFLTQKFESVLVEGVPTRDRARTLELLGKLGLGIAHRNEVRQYAEQWLEAASSVSDRWSRHLTAAMLARQAVDGGREDLATQIVFLLLRSITNLAADLYDAQTVAEVESARRLFVQHAEGVWLTVKDVDPVAITLRSDGPDVFVAHPVKSARLAECLALLGVLDVLSDNSDGRPEAIGNYLAAFFDRSPAMAHPVSDEWAFSLLPIVVLLAMTDHFATARSILHEAAVWILDRFDYGHGLAHVGSSAEEATRQLLGVAYPSMKTRHIASSYAAAVVADLAYLCGFRDLFNEFVRDLDAVGGFASIVFERSAVDVDLVARIAYRLDGGPAAPHFGAAELVVGDPPLSFFDSLARWATLRDRHTPATLLKLLSIGG